MENQQNHNNESFHHNEVPYKSPLPSPRHYLFLTLGSKYTSIHASLLQARCHALLFSPFKVTWNFTTGAHVSLAGVVLC